MDETSTRRWAANDGAVGSMEAPGGLGAHPSDPQSVSGDLGGLGGDESQDDSALVVSLRNSLAAAEREAKKAVAMERLAARHATRCDADVAEADARLARREADVKRLEAVIARQRVELFDARNTSAYERGITEGLRRAGDAITWGVTCLGCADQLDGLIAERAAGYAEGRLDALTEELAQSDGCAAALDTLAGQEQVAAFYRLHAGHVRAVLAQESTAMPGPAPTVDIEPDPRLHAHEVGGTVNGCPDCAAKRAAEQDGGKK